MPTAIVGVGASAGGLEALIALFEAMPALTGLAFVVAQHLSPDHRSLMPELLARKTRVRVLAVEQGMVIEPDTVYLLPPRYDVTVRSGRLHLTEYSTTGGLHLPIDVLFRSLAEDQGSRAIVVVLSGTGSDGSRGVRAVKEAGGTAFVQEPVTAKFDGMPRAATSTGLVDFVLAPEHMGHELVRFARAQAWPTHDQVPAPPDTRDLDGKLAAVLALVERDTGVDFRAYKPSTLLRRVERRIAALDLAGVDAYLERLANDPAESDLLRREFLIGVTRFFRDPKFFELLSDAVLPEIIQSEGFTGSIRVWVAACSTGEEAYSIAMVCTEALRRLRAAADVKIFATDVDTHALAQAALGSYPASLVADVSPQRLAEFFDKDGDDYRVTAALRSMVVFAPHNVLRDPPFTRLDLVSCRNMLIYLESDFQRRVLGMFHFALRKGGFLFLGNSETVGDAHDAFSTFDSRARIFRSTGAGRSLQREFALAAADTSANAPVRAHVGAVTGRRVVEQAFALLAHEYCPPGVVIDARGTVLHIVGDVSRLLRVPAGAATLNLYQLAAGSLGAVVMAAANKAQRERAEIRYHGVVLEQPGRPTLRVDVRVIPLRSPSGELDHLMVLFERAGLPVTAAEPGDEPVALDVAVQQQLDELRLELRYTQENLQATIEELETANEELQSTNEELIAANEELQATNEELQATNEELHTVNAEYQRKIDELVLVNSDIDNLLDASQVGVLFVDAELRVRRFTPTVREFVALRTGDEGRPLADFSMRVPGVDLVQLVQRVIAGGAGVEIEAALPSGAFVLVRGTAYRSQDPQLSSTGVMLAFVDVTPIKRAERALQEVLDSLPEHVAVLDDNGVIRMVNEAWRRFGSDNGAAPLHDDVGINYLEVLDRALAHGDMSVESAASGLREVLQRRRDSFTLEYPCSSPEQQRWYLMHASPLRYATGLVVSHLDITARKLRELEAGGHAARVE
jgi:two-component system CheB/CheR fusion protein